MRESLKFGCILAFCLLSINQLKAQVFPVRASATYTGTFSPRIEEWIDPAGTGLRIMLTLVDDEKLNDDYQVKLRFLISGPDGVTLRSDLNIVNPVSLSYNQPVLLDYSILEAYLGLDNLIFSGGFSKADYVRVGHLPEGFYSICVEAYDIERTDLAPVSNTVCVNRSLRLNDPPTITAPIGAKLLPKGQPLQFTWLYNHPQTFVANYELSIYRLEPGMSINDVLQFESPVFTTTVVNQNQYLYGPADPPLDYYTDYVIILVASDMAGNEVFNNEGMAEPKQFILTECLVGTACDDGDDCTRNDVFVDNCNCQGTFFDNNKDGLCDLYLVPEALDEKVDGELGFTAHFRPSDAPNVVSHRIEISTDEGFSNIILSESDISVLGEFSRYQEAVGDHEEYWYRIFAVLDDGTEVESNHQYVKLGSCDFTGIETVDLGCGVKGPTLDLASAELASGFNVGDKFIANDIIFEVTEVTSFADGVLSGKAVASFGLPALGGDALKVNATMTGITINNRCQMIAGEVVINGAGIQIVSEEVAAFIQNTIIPALEALDDYVGEALEEVQSILDDIQDVIDGASEHVSEETKQKVQDAKDALDEAIDDYNDDPSEENKRKVEEKKKELEDALKELQEESAQVVQEALDIFAMILDELKEECNLDQLLSEAESDIAEVKAASDATFAGGGSDAGFDDGEIIVETVEQELNLGAFGTLVEQMAEQRSKYYECKIVQVFISDFEDDSNKEKVLTFVRGFGLDFVNEVNSPRFEGKTEGEIVSGLKGAVKEAIINIAQRI